MVAVAITRLEHGAADLRLRATRLSDADAVRRLLAIALLLEGSSREAAASATGMDRQTLRDWVHRYNAQGPSGLSDRKAPGRTPLLTPEQEEVVADWVRTGPSPEVDGVVRWRRCDLAARIERDFGVRIAVKTVGTLLRRLGFVRLSARPQHPNQDSQALEAHKKTLPTLLPARSRSTPVASRSNCGGRTRPVSASREP
jgi:transposase